MCNNKNKCNNCKCKSNKSTISTEDNRRYMVIVSLVSNESNLEIFDFGLRKEDIPATIERARDLFADEVDEIKTCEHTDFIDVGV